MKSLRFDPSAAVHAERGVSAEQLRAIYRLLEQVRLNWLGPDSDSAAPSGDAAYRLPRELLLAYRQQREASPLGQIFRVANTLMDQLDAVVVLGSADCFAGPQSLMTACCDPLHNELRRGPRGGKPRMYFTGYDFDNDRIQSLLSRLQAGGYGDSTAESRWALVVCDPKGDSIETSALLPLFWQALRESVNGDSYWLSRLLIPVTTADSPLMKRAMALGCSECVVVPTNLHPTFSVLSAVGLLPTAMLGLDIMKLLQGAAAMNDHFESSAPDQNLVMQGVAVNRLLDIHQHRTQRLFAVNTQALEGIGYWYQQLVESALARAGSATQVFTLVETRDYPSQLQRLQGGRSHVVLNRVHLQRIRTDPLRVHISAGGIDRLGDLAEWELSDMMAAATQCATESCRDVDCPITELIIPTIDTYWLGQLLQLLIISTLAEARLLGFDAYDSTALQTFRTRFLTRLRES